MIGIILIVMRTVICLELRSISRSLKLSKYLCDVISHRVHDESGHQRALLRSLYAKPGPENVIHVIAVDNYRLC